MAIGIFDSGIGGLTVVKEIIKEFPNQQIIYFGDTKRIPYGNKKKEELIIFADQIVSFLIKNGVNIIIVACNTTSAVALNYLKKKYNKIPIIGILIPAANISSEITKGKIGILATEVTVKSNYYKKVIKKINNKIKVISISCPELVPFIENGDIGSNSLKKILKEYLKPISSFNCDTLILGCTHYPFLENIINDLIDESVRIINPAEHISIYIKKFILKDNLLKDNLCYISGEYNKFYSNLINIMPNHGFKKIISFDPIKIIKY